jgi:hypothetical protein
MYFQRLGRLLVVTAETPPLQPPTGEAANGVR